LVLPSSNKTAAKGELVFTSFLFVVAVTVLVDTAGMTKSNAVGFVGPEVFAYMVGGLLLVLSGAQIIAVLRGERGTPEGVEGGVAVSDPNWKSFGILVLGVVLFALLMPIVGFPIMGAVLYFLVAKAIGAKHNIRTAIIAVLLSLTVFFAFNEGLKLQLPSGLDTVENILNPVDENAPTEEIVDENGVVVEEDGGW
jgi:putative tricarboxylic transport membrane protein